MTQKARSKNTDSLTKYKEEQERIAQLINQIQTKLDKHSRDAKINWGHVGDLTYVLAQLNEIDEFLG